MAGFSSLIQPDRGQAAHLVHMVAQSDPDQWRATLNARQRAAVDAGRFAAKPGEMVILPGDDADDWSVAVGMPAKPTPWDLAGAAQKLPAGTYRLAQPTQADAALGWLLAHYRYTRYLSSPEPMAERVLLTADVAHVDATVALAEAVALVRDLVNTPAADMGPAQLAAAIEEEARGHGARIAIHHGDALEHDFPCVAAVGRAAAKGREPRLVEVEWGDENHPRIAIIGKGVCFDTGGLDIKPSSAMLLMKKDMGGAAHALALARLVMRSALPVRLHLLIPIVENSVAGDAFRPGDVLRSRKGISVEIGNTDAEGRLILADALALACERKPELMLDFATLTGAARVALGPELPALFTNDDALAEDLVAAGSAVADPLWRLPLWQPYADMLKSEIADVNNAGEGGMAGSITAALFLQKFVEADIAWAHFDTFAWMPSSRPGRPKGGDALGLRASWQMLRQRFG